MDKEKIDEFYDDPIKQAADYHSIERAFFLRSLSTKPGPLWAYRRWVRFLGHLGIGALRAARERAVLKPPRRLQQAVEQ